MAQFFEAALAYPTVFFSGALILVLLYWAMVIVGIFDIDALDFDFLEGAGEGLEGLEGLDGALDGGAEALDGALDGVLDGAMDGAADGLLDGAAEALDGAADAAGDAADAATSASALATVMAALRLRSVPVTISVSFITLVGWLSSFILMDKVAPHLVDTLPMGLIAAGFGLAALTVGVLITSVAVRPLAPIFESQQGVRRADFVGASCEISTSRVDGRFGQAQLEDGGAGQLVQVRCDAGNTLKKGDRALVVSFDTQREAFVVEPFSSELAQALADESSPTQRKPHPTREAQ